MSKQPKNINKSGFTIIEVVLVLAIAGLIFLMVFVAFPALQRNQRDTQRREDYAMLQSQIISKYSDNGNTPPTNVTATNMVIGKDGKDPEGNAYDIRTYAGTGAIVPTNVSSTTDLKDVEAGGSVVVYIPQAECTADGLPIRESVSSGSPAFKQSKNSFVIYGSLENGTYCRTATFN